MSGLVGIGKLKKVSHKVDLDGNLIDARTGESAGKVEEKGYTPTPQEVAILAAKRGGEKHLTKEELADALPGNKKKGRPAKPKLAKIPNVPRETTPANGLDGLISKVLEKKIGGAIEKALANIDLNKIVEDAIDKMI